MKRTAKIVYHTRRMLNLSQQEFAREIGVSRDSVANYETGRNDPPGSVMLKVLDLAGRQFKDQ